MADMPLRRSLPDGVYRYVFQGTVPVLVVASLRRDRRLVISASASGYPEVQLNCGLDTGLVAIVDLLGSGEGSSAHRQGLGTLVVNIAIKFLKVLRSPRDSIWGCALNTDVRRYTAVSNNPAKCAGFWRRFGLFVSPPDPFGDRLLRGRIADLVTVEQGSVLGLYPRQFDLRNMSYNAEEISG